MSAAKLRHSWMIYKHVRTSNLSNTAAWSVPNDDAPLSTKASALQGKVAR